MKEEEKSMPMFEAKVTMQLHAEKKVVFKAEEVGQKNDSDFWYSKEL